MKTLFYTISVLLLLAGCRVHTGSGNIVSKDIPPKPFSGIRVEGPLVVELRQGSPATIQLETDDNLQKFVDIDFNDRILNAEVKKGNFRDATFRLLVTAPDITSLKVSAAGKIEMQHGFKNDAQLVMESSSAGKITGKVDAPKVKVSASSGSEIDLTGQTRFLEADGSSGSNIDVSELLSENADASASSGAGVNVHASVKLKANASSGGKVSYRGGAAVNESTGSGGSVVRY